MKTVLSTIFILIILPANLSFGQEEYLDLRRFQRELKKASSDTQRAKALLSIGFHFLLKPGERTNDIKAAKAYCDAAGNVASRLRSDSLQGAVLFLLSQIEREGGNRDSSLVTLNKSIAKFRACGAFTGEGNALMEKRHYFELSGDQLKQRIELVTSALQLFRKAGDKRRQADTLQELGDLYGNDGKTIEAIDFLRQAAKLYKEIKFKRVQYLYSTLNIAYTIIGDYRRGLQYGFDAERTALSLGDSSVTLCTIYNRIGLTYYYLGEVDNTLAYFKKGLANAVANKYQDGVIYLTSNIITKVLARDRGKVQSMLPELDRILTSDSTKVCKPVLFSDMCRTYLLVGNSVRAKFFLDKLYEFQRSKPINDIENIYVFRAAYEYYFHTGDLKSAARYLAKEKILAERVSDLRRLQAVYQSMYTLDSANGNFSSAFTNLKKFKTVSDSLAASNSRSELQTLTVRYQLEKKNDEIKLKSENIKLLTKDNDAQKILIQKADTIRNITVVAVAMLVCLLLALYSRWRANRKNSKIIADKNLHLEQLVREKDWLVREIHHRVKNNLQTIISLLESQASYLRDDALEAVLDSQHRVHAMSLIHQKLYLIENSTSIDMGAYIEELVYYLTESFAVNARILIVSDIEDISLDVSYAIPVGLIINESVTNAIKYAFPEQQEGELKVELKKGVGQVVTLRVKDNGVGLPTNINPKEMKSLGMRLI